MTENWRKVNLGFIEKKTDDLYNMYRKFIKAKREIIQISLTNKEIF